MASANICDCRVFFAAFPSRVGHELFVQFLLASHFHFFGIDNDDKKFPVLSKAPAVLKEGLQFPYFYGAGFVQALLKKGGWSRLNEAYATLPASTEQVMHPEKFLTKESPVKIELADLSAALGRDWKRIDTDVNGEFGYQILLAEFLVKHTARNAARRIGAAAPMNRVST